MHFFRPSWFLQWHPMLAAPAHLTSRNLVCTPFFNWVVSDSTELEVERGFVCDTPWQLLSLLKSLMREQISSTNASSTLFTTLWSFNGVMSSVKVCTATSLWLTGCVRDDGGRKKSISVPLKIKEWQFFWSFSTTLVAKEIFEYSSVNPEASSLTFNFFASSVKSLTYSDWQQSCQDPSVRSQIL